MICWQTVANISHTMMIMRLALTRYACELMMAHVINTFNSRLWSKFIQDASEWSWAQWLNNLMFLFYCFCNESTVYIFYNIFFHTICRPRITTTPSVLSAPSRVVLIHDIVFVERQDGMLYKPQPYLHWQIHESSWSDWESFLNSNIRPIVRYSTTTETIGSIANKLGIERSDRSRQYVGL